MTDYERTKVRDFIAGMTEEEKEIAREVLAVHSKCLSMALDRENRLVGFCSNCGTQVFATKHCGNCGARMDGAS